MDSILPRIKWNFGLLSLLLDAHNRCFKLHSTIAYVQKLHKTN